MLEGITVELFLVQYDERGWFTQLERRAARLARRTSSRRPAASPVASTAALAGYRHSYRVDARRRCSAEPISAANSSSPARDGEKLGTSCSATPSARRDRGGAARASSAGCASRSASRGARSPSRSQVAAFDPADDASWERLEEALIYADVGVRATAELIRRLEARQEL